MKYPEPFKINLKTIFTKFNSFKLFLTLQTGLKSLVKHFHSFYGSKIVPAVLHNFCENQNFSLATFCHSNLRFLYNSITKLKDIPIPEIKKRNNTIFPNKIIYSLKLNPIFYDYFFTLYYKRKSNTI